jgi:hypothetical protein
MLEFVDGRMRHFTKGSSRKQKMKINVIHDPPPGRDRVHYSGAKFPLSDYLYLDLCKDKCR